MSTTVVKSFGIIVNNLDDNLITQLNEIVKDFHYCPIVFTSNPAYGNIKPIFTILQLSHAWSFTGPLISTNIETTRFLNNCVVTKNKLFYVQELEWAKLNNISYSFLQQIYNNDNIELISNDATNIFLINIWKRSIININNWDYTKLTLLMDKLYEIN